MAASDSFGQPVVHWKASCPPLAPTIDRMTANLSIIFASRGNTSQMSMPGTAVLIGLNSPRTSAGASGLRSHRSWCGGPPPRKTLMTALCPEPEEVGDGLLAASAR